MTRSRKNIETASHFAAALHQLLVEERVLREAPKTGRSAQLGDLSIDRLYQRLGAELGFRVDRDLIDHDPAIVASPILNSEDRVAAERV
jgi:hypothetical protein